MQIATIKTINPVSLEFFKLTGFFAVLFYLSRSEKGQHINGKNSKNILTA